MNSYYNSKITLSQAITDAWVVFLGCILMVIVDAFEGFIGFYWAGVAVATLIILVAVYRAYRSGELWLTTDDIGIRLRNGKFYSWSDLKSIEQRKVDPNTKLNWCPGYKLHFKNGDDYFVFQTLENYTDLYLELYRRKIPGSQRPLYLFEINRSTGAKKMAGTKHQAIFHPEKNDVEPKVAEPVYWW